MAETDHDDGITYLPSGMVQLRLDGREVMLRRPKVREVKALRELLQRHSDEDVAASHVAMARQDQLHRAWQEQDQRLEQALEDATGDRAAELLNERAQAMTANRQARMQLTRDLNDPIEGRRAEWVREAVSTLGRGGELPEDLEDWPAWLLDDQVPVQLLKHWTTVPSGSGPSR